MRLRQVAASSAAAPAAPRAACRRRARQHARPWPPLRPHATATATIPRTAAAATTTASPRTGVIDDAALLVCEHRQGAGAVCQRGNVPHHQALQERHRILALQAGAHAAQAGQARVEAGAEWSGWVAAGAAPAALYINTAAPPLRGRGCGRAASPPRLPGLPALLQLAPSMRNTPQAGPHPGRCLRRPTREQLGGGRVTQPPPPPDAAP